MSKITKPDSEPNVTCGFFNSSDSSRREYDAETFSSIFNNLITDGVFSSVGNMLVVESTGGLNLTISPGRCWFDGTWLLNEDVTTIVCEESDSLLNRIDAVVVRINKSETIKDATFEIIKGKSAGEPVRPTLSNSGKVYEHALCYIYRKAGSTEITQSDITNVIGTDETPFVTGILQTVSLDKLFGQWTDDLNRFRDSEKTKTDEFLSEQEGRVEVFIDNKNREYEEFQSEKETSFNEWYAGMQQMMSDVVTEVDTWSDNFKSSVLTWFNEMKNQLSTDAAINLQLQFDKAEYWGYITCGFPQGTKTISENGKVIRSTYNDLILTKTFSDDFSSCETVLTDKNDIILGMQTKTFSADGLTITSSGTIIM